MGLLLRDRGKTTEALELWAEALKVQRQLVEAAPCKSSFRELLASLLNNQANQYKLQGRLDETERAHSEAHGVMERLCADFPSTARYQQQLATVLNNLANAIKVNPSRRGEARDALTRAIDIQEKLVATAPSVPDYLLNLATICDNLASLHRAQEHDDLAEAMYRRVLEYHARLTNEHKQVPDYRFYYGQTLHNLADFLRGRGRLDDALSLSRQAVQEFTILYQSNRKEPETRTAISYAYWTLCTILVDRKNHREAAAMVAEYLRIEPNGFEESSESTALLCQCARICRQDATLPAAERESLFRTYCDRALDALRTAVAAGYQDLNALKSSAMYEPVRERADFQQLVRDIETRSKPPGPGP